MVLIANKAALQGMRHLSPCSTHYAILKPQKEQANMIARQHADCQEMLVILMHTATTSRTYTKIKIANGGAAALVQGETTDTQSAET